MKNLLPITMLCCAAMYTNSCAKHSMENKNAGSGKSMDKEVLVRKSGGGSTATFIDYTIQAGNHQCDQSRIRSVRTSEMKFIARFNESGVYTSVLPENQYDINKLYGFSEGYDNQYNSARIGWNWVDGNLRLHGYVYTNGVRSYALLGNYALNTEIACSIKLAGDSYIIAAGPNSVVMARGLSSRQASGYQQYPYFGGDEAAPHRIAIGIKAL